VKACFFVFTGFSPRFTARFALSILICNAHSSHTAQDKSCRSDQLKAGESLLFVFTGFSPRFTARLSYSSGQILSLNFLFGLHNPIINPGYKLLHREQNS